MIHCFLKNLGTWKEENKDKGLQHRHKVHAETQQLLLLETNDRAVGTFLGHTPANGLVASIAKAAVH